MLDLNDDVRETAWTEAYSSSEPFSCGGDVKTNYDPEPWEWLKSVPKEARLPEKRRLGITSPSDL